MGSSTNNIGGSRAGAGTKSGSHNKSSKNNSNKQRKDISGHSIGIQKSSGKGKGTRFDFGTMQTNSMTMTKDQSPRSSPRQSQSLASTQASRFSQSAPALKKGGELQVFTYGPGSAFPHSNFNDSNSNNSSNRGAGAGRISGRVAPLLPLATLLSTGRAM